MLDVTQEYDKYFQHIRENNTLNYRVLAARSNMASKNPILTVVCWIQMLGRWLSANWNIGEPCSACRHAKHVCELSDKVIYLHVWV